MPISSHCSLPAVLLAAAHPGPPTPSSTEHHQAIKNNSSLKDLLERNLKGKNSFQHIKTTPLIRAFLVVLSNSCDRKDVWDLMLFGGPIRFPTSHKAISKFKIAGWFWAPALFLYLTKNKIKEDTKTRNINSRWNCVLLLLEVILYLSSVLLEARVSFSRNPQTICLHQIYLQTWQTIAVKTLKSTGDFIKGDRKSFSESLLY